jgi:hypothetical protein
MTKPYRTTAGSWSKGREYGVGTSHDEKIRQLDELETRPLGPSAEARALLRDEVVAYAADALQKVGGGGRPPFVMPEGEDSALQDAASNAHARTR